jgi:hypothetical protein
MKEYTIIYTAEITEVKKGDAPEIDKEQLAAWIESTLGVDDVHIKGNVKVFEREL